METTSEPITAHKADLVARSAYFRAMLTSGVGAGRAGPVEIRNTTPAALRIILEYLYTDEVRPDTDPFPAHHESVLCL